MSPGQKLKYLKLALRVIGVVFVFGISLLMWLWPSAWTFTPNQPEYDQMMIGIYATLGVFLFRASSDPVAHASLIWFTVWSSIVHGGIMLVQVIVDTTEHSNLYGDIPGLFLVALILWYLMPDKSDGNLLGL